MTKIDIPSAHPTALPEVLPIFPLAGVVLLPRVLLPLNVHESAYLALVETALGQGRIVGLIQPKVSVDVQNNKPPLYQVGCAGRITSFSETDDGRLLVSLLGLHRFQVKEELAQDAAYRRVRPDWQKYAGDIMPAADGSFDRPHLMLVLRHYLKIFGIAADWNAVQNTTDEMLIASLTMMCPLEPNEKQALLEAEDLKTRAELLTALLEMAALPQSETETARH
jgi:Lon protease-like protein